MEMTNETNELDMKVGTKEMSSLKPKPVKIISAEVVDVKSKEQKMIGKKLNLFVKHPDKIEAVLISSVQYIKGKEIKDSGIWLTRDSENNIQKGSALAILLDHTGTKTIRELTGKEVNTILDAKGYLTIKCY